MAAALANGVHENGVADLVDQPAENGTAAVDAIVEPAPRGLYFVRIPKPPMDDTQLKKLQAEFQAHVTKLKGINAKLAAKRDVVRGFKTQMNEARGLKETSEPEFQDKYSRIVELRNLRSSYIKRMKTIRENLSAFDCKSEAELDEKIRAIEHRITHEGVALREEKQLVQQVAKLNAIRPKLKEYEPLKAELTELETEANKIKQIIDSMDSEFSVIKKERDATKEVVQEIYEKLKKAQDELQALEAEQADVVALKDAALKALDGTRDETNASMSDFRENRKFSLSVRDLVAASRTDEAAALVRAQVDEWVAKLSTDTAYYKEYQTLWAGQRKAPVSELLPKSCTNAVEPASAKPAGKGAAGARAPPPEPRGAEKAKLLIEQLMQEASREAAAAKGRAGVQGGSDADEEDEEEEAPAAAQPAKKAAEPYKPPAVAAAATTTATKDPAKLVKDPAAAAAAAFNFKVEVPKIEDTGFVLPVIKSDVEEQSKEQIREEQIRKNQEAEERKRKRAEAAERKRQQAADTARRLEAERKERDAAARVAAQQKAAAAAAAETAAQESAPAEEAAPAQSVSAPSNQQQQVTKMSAPTPFEKRQAVAAAKRVKSKATPAKQVQSIWKEHQASIIFAAVMALVVILIYIYLQS